MGFPSGSAGKNPPAVQETWVQSLGQEEPLEEGMATHSSILVGKIPWREETGGLLSMGLQKSWTWLKQLTTTMYLFCLFYLFISYIYIYIFLIYTVVYIYINPSLSTSTYPLVTIGLLSTSVPSVLMTLYNIIIVYNIQLYLSLRWVPSLVSMALNSLSGNAYQKLALEKHCLKKRA